jgi:hypothetical protein
MKKKVLSLLTLFLAFGLALPAQPVSPAALVPQDAQWILHLDVKKFVSTQLFDLLKNDHGSKLDQFNTRISEKLKIDLLKDIEGVTIFGQGKDRSNAVVCLAGNLDKNYLLTLLAQDKNHEETSYGKYTIHRWRSSHCGVFANNHLVLLGSDEGAIKNALDVIDGKKKNMTASPLMSYWRESPTGAFLRVAAHHISSLARDHDTSAILKKAGMAFFMALEKNETLKLKLKLTTDTPETAKNIEQIVMGFMALARMKQNDRESTRHMRFFKLLENVQIKVEGNVLQMELSQPSAELAEMLAHGKKDW